jgi:hypothetical protein
VAQLNQKPDAGALFSDRVKEGVNKHNYFKTFKQQHESIHH